MTPDFKLIKHKRLLIALSERAKEHMRGQTASNSNGYKGVTRGKFHRLDLISIVNEIDCYDYVLVDGNNRPFKDFQ